MIHLYRLAWLVTLNLNNQKCYDYLMCLFLSLYSNFTMSDLRNMGYYNSKLERYNNWDLCE